MTPSDREQIARALEEAKAIVSTHSTAIGVLMRINKALALIRRAQASPSAVVTDDAKRRRIAEELRHALHVAVGSRAIQGTYVQEDTDKVDRVEVIVRAALAASSPKPSADGWDRGAMAMRDVADERKRQVEAEGWTAAHDDEHSRGEMAQAAVCYALSAISTKSLLGVTVLDAASIWPWDAKWWKPKDPRRDLVRAGALILAEIERLDRLPIPQEPGR